MGDLEIQYYEHLCLCGCGNKIEIKKHHKYSGIPNYLLGHQNRNKTFSEYHNKKISKILKGNKRSTKHDGYQTKLYMAWSAMKQRCLYSKHKSYKDYGGRGITICNEWLAFIPFRDWALSNGYKEGLQINRIFNDGNYEPSNCNFIPAKENTRNRRGQKIKNMEIANEIRYLDSTGNYTQQELAEMYNVSQQTISQIIHNKIWGFK